MGPPGAAGRGDGEGLCNGFRASVSQGEMSFGEGGGDGCVTSHVYLAPLCAYSG